MPENSILRAVSVIAIMLLTGFTWLPVRLAWLKKRGMEKHSAKKQAALEAKKASIVAAFLYVVFMVSLVQLFL